jgi:hypothetical protein
VTTPAAIEATVDVKGAAIGRRTLYQIGTKIVEAAAWPPGVKTVFRTTRLPRVVHVPGCQTSGSATCIYLVEW